MAVFHRSLEKRRLMQDLRRHEEEVIGSLCRLSNRPASPKSQMEQERRIRREIANSNERRRMQSINAGFQSLRTLLPHSEGEKLSKAAILQQTTQYIYQMEQEKTRLLTQNCQLKRLLNQQNQDSDGGSSSDSPLPKRKKSETVEVPLPIEEAIVNVSSNPNASDHGNDELRREMIELRVQLERERRLRMSLEDQTRALESQLFPEKVRAMEHRAHLQYQTSTTESRSDSDSHRTASPSLKRERSISPKCITVPIATAEATLVYVEASSPRLSGHGDSRGSLCQMRSVSVDDDIVLEDEDEESCLSSPKTPRSASPQVVPSVPQLQQLPNNTSLSTSRQNLETIVEAIRHLEGDHLFNDDPAPRRIAKMEPRETLLTIGQADQGYRHHVIRASQVQSRPGVIVSAHS